MTCLTLVRHGQSEWNLENRFTGWVDVNLTPFGEEQAKKAGQMLAEKGYAFDLAYTSFLKRAIRTLWYVLAEMDLYSIPVEKDWRLNERHYGALSGLNKAEVRQEYGDEQVKLWRRSYDIPPPPIEENNPYHPRFDKRYKGLDFPRSESLKTTLDRVVPYFKDQILPNINSGKSIIIAAHGNTVRALVKYLLNLSSEQILSVEIPTGNPLILEKDTDKMEFKTASFLDSENAEPFPFVNELA